LKSISSSTIRHPEEGMSSDKKSIRFTLTPEQRAQVRELTGKDAEAVELTAQELEERIAPFTGGSHGF
jgi:hypothetical protein